MCWSRIPHLPCVTSAWHLDSWKTTLSVRSIFLKNPHTKPIYFMLKIQPLYPSWQNSCSGFPLRNRFPHLLLRDTSWRIFDHVTQVICFQFRVFWLDISRAVLINVYFCVVWYPNVIPEKDRVQNRHAAKRNRRFTGARGCVTNLNKSQNSEICHASPCASKSMISLSCVTILDSVFFWDYIWVSYNTEININ